VWNRRINLEKLLIKEYLIKQQRVRKSIKVTINIAKDKEYRSFVSIHLGINPVLPNYYCSIKNE